MGNQFRRGMIPVKGPMGDVYRERLPIDEAGADDLYIGDPIAKMANGKIQRAVAGGGAFLGAICSFHDYDDNPLEWYEAGTQYVWAECAVARGQLFEIQDPTWQLVDPDNRENNAALQFDPPDVFAKLSGAVMNAGSAAPGDNQLRIIEPVLRVFPYRYYNSEASMLRYEALVNEQGRTDAPEVGEVVWRTDLQQFWYALNTDNADMGDWALCAIGDTNYPIASWVVMVNQHQREHGAGV